MYNQITNLIKYIFSVLYLSQKARFSLYEQLKCEGLLYNFNVEF